MVRSKITLLSCCYTCLQKELINVDSSILLLSLLDGHLLSINQNTGDVVWSLREGEVVVLRINFNKVVVHVEGVAKNEGTCVRIRNT